MKKHQPTPLVMKLTVQT